VTSTDVPALPLLDHYLELYANGRPETVALSCPEFEFNYLELQDVVTTYASAFQTTGVARGDVVAVLGNSRPECWVIFLACCRIGAVFLGLNPKYTARELSFVLSDSRPRVLLGMYGPDEREQAEKLRTLISDGGPIATVVLRTGARAGESVSLEKFLGSASVSVGTASGHADPEDPCAIVYTSGSTGMPKGAMLCQRGMIRSALLTWRHWYGAKSELRTVAQHPINHVGWLVCECATALVAGGTLFLRERFDGASTLRLIERDRLNVWIAFPSMVILAVQSPEFETCDLSSLERLAFGMSPSLELQTRLRTRTDAVFSVSYGLTEAHGGAVTVTDDDADLETVADTIGRPLPGIEVRIVDVNGVGVPTGRPGELLIRDPCLFLGYLNRPEASAETIDSQGWLHTDDVVAQDESGVMRFVARKKDMFKSGGYNVYPTEIESVIGSHEMVRHVAVVEVPDPLWEEVGIAFVALGEHDSLGSVQLVEYLQPRLANYKIPKRFVFVTELPQLPNGKVDKVGLRERAKSLMRDKSGPG
jgi:acyl-CoA synthetase (AMP-forming)/AMP-acid ligase II